MSRESSPNLRVALSSASSVADWPTASARSLRFPAGAALLAMSVVLTTLDLTPSTVEGEDFAVDWQTLLRLALCGACGLYGLNFLPSTMPALVRFPGVWIVLFGLWAIVTIAVGSSILYALAAVFSLWCMILFAPAVLENLGSARVLEIVTKALIFFVALNWFLYFAVPQLGRYPFMMPDGTLVYRLGGDANQLGLQVTWATGFVLVLAFEREYRLRTALIILPFLGATLLLTQSRTAMITTFAVACAVLWHYSRAWQRWLVGACAVLLATGAMFMFGFAAAETDIEMLASGVSRSGSSQEVFSLTGRDAIWELAWLRIQESPVFGWGYGCARFPLEDPSMSFEGQHAHNLLLNVALCMGFPGAALLVAMIVHQLIRSLVHRAIVLQIATVFVLIAGITEPVLFGPMPRSHTVIWLLAMFWLQCGSDRPHRVEGSRG